jgi:hypothetical protein
MWHCGCIIMGLFDSYECNAHGGLDVRTLITTFNTALTKNKSVLQCNAHSLYM